jgi:hypothetical protein
VALLRQAFDPSGVRVYSPQLGAFEKYDTSADPPEVAAERLWVERRLRVERRKNLRLGISERLAVTVARVQAMHKVGVTGAV